MSSVKIDPTAVSLLSEAPVDHALAGRTRTKQRISLSTKRRIMSRRANLIGICGITSLCILLLIATTQHRPLPATLATNSLSLGGAVGGSSGDVPSGMGSVFVAGGDHSMPQVAQPVIVYNLTATVEQVLAAQRAKIAAEMENFEYPAGRFGVDAEQLSDLTLETKGTPVRSIILTTWRSGSTFLGDILNAMPGNYYHYEPLLDVGIKQLRTAEEGVLALQNLKSLLNCDYSDLEEYLDFGRTHTYLFEHNVRLWTMCKEFPLHCWRKRFLTQFCKLFPMQSMKSVRLRLSLAEALLEDENLNVRIILLVRDPRGTMQSRKHRVWCAGNPDCDEPARLCEDLEDDYKSAVELLNKYPTRFRTLRYEDLSLNPYEMTQDILQFYGLPFDPLVEEFLDTHTKVNIGGVSSTYRDSKSAPFHWKQDLKIEEINIIQNGCARAMGLWGYRYIDNFTDFQTTFDPMILPAPFT